MLHAKEQKYDNNQFELNLKELKLQLFSYKNVYQIHSFFHKNNFIRTKDFVLVKNKEQSQAYCPADHKNKVSRLAISKIIRA